MSNTNQVVKVGPAVAANASLFFASATPTSGTPLTLLTNSVDVPRRISLAYGNEAGPRTMTLVGTNRYSRTITEILNVPSGGAGSPIQTQNDFLTLVSATPAGGGWSAAATLGTSGTISSEWKAINSYISPVNLAIGVIVSGTVNFTIEYTYDDLNNLLLGGAQGFSQEIVPNLFTLAALASKSANTDGALNEPAWAWRLTLNSFTNPGFATATGIQAGITQ